MNITVLGIGYVGLVTGTCLAEIGNDVACFDVDHEKIDLLRTGEVPFHERDLAELIRRNAGLARLRFTTDVADAVRHGEVIFIATGTPAEHDGSANLSYVMAAARSIGEHMQNDKIVVQKSTVPVGTAERVRSVIVEQIERRRAARDQDVVRLTAMPVAVVSNPEFLKEGAAVDDFMRPDRIVIGSEPGAPGERPRAVMSQLLCAVQPPAGQDAAHGRPLGGNDEIRGERDARHPHQLHERTRQPCRRAGCRHRAGAQGDRRRPSDRLRLSLRRRRLWRKLLSERRSGARPHCRGAWTEASDLGSGARRQRRACSSTRSSTASAPTSTGGPSRFGDSLSSPTQTTCERRRAES